MFSQASIILLWGGGRAWQRGHAWQRGACMAKGRHAWQGACMVGACIAGGMHGSEACVAGEMATAVDITHPIGMHSSYM